MFERSMSLTGILPAFQPRYRAIRDTGHEFMTLRVPRSCVLMCVVAPLVCLELELNRVLKFKTGADDLERELDCVCASFSSCA